MGRAQESVKIAAVQAAPVAFNLTESLKKVEQFTAQAASQGAELVAFPEAFLSAYPWRYAFDATVGTREPRGMNDDVSYVANRNPADFTQGRHWYRKYYESSVAIPSTEFNTLQNAAKENSINLSIGIIEKDGGTLYCTAVLIGKDGTLLNRHRKVCDKSHK